MINERHSKRETLIYNLKVYDTYTNKIIGYVDDISINGARLLSEEQMPADTVSNYRMELPEFYEGKRSVEFSALTTWSEGDETGNDFFDCGMKFLTMDPLDRERISQLIGGYHI